MGFKNYPKTLLRVCYDQKTKLVFSVMQNA